MSCEHLADVPEGTTLVCRICDPRNQRALVRVTRSYMLSCGDMMDADSAEVIPVGATVSCPVCGNLTGIAEFYRPPYDDSLDHPGDGEVTPPELREML